ncbi:MAG: DUF3224 domain-containing protein [Trebonia sp.]
MRPRRPALDRGSSRGRHEHFGHQQDAGGSRHHGARIPARLLRSTGRRAVPHAHPRRGRVQRDIEGAGVVEFLQAARADGSASFVGIERVTGAVAGRTGSFLLRDSGTVTGSVVAGDWFVVPGSGTGELAGLRGEGGFRANLGENADVHPDYWFD